MKKGLLASLLALPLLICGCNETVTRIDVPTYSDEISAFSLTGPENGFIAQDSFTFTWEEARNAETYSIEISATENFYNDKDAIYVKENNISQNFFELNYTLPEKDITYYWRVTAVNSKKQKKSNEVGTFFYKSHEVGELHIDIEDAQDWAVHKEGSQAEVSIDRNNFFDNGGKNSLAIKFDKEHTNSEDISRTGWIVITKNADMELYGTDSFYLNFYYSGQDSTILIRVLDGDGEYWHHRVSVSRNSKQTVLLKYEDFELRTAGTNIFNREFDWQHIHYFEIVFEKTFGDGICMLSDIRAVKFENYNYMFLSKMTFDQSEVNTWDSENYEFTKQVLDGGNELRLSYAAGFPGYGFQYINVYKFFGTNDALRMKVKYTGTNSASNFVFRVIEEDKDAWQYKLPFSHLVKDEFVEVVIPLKGLKRQDYMNGDGAKQFFYVTRFKYGLNENYSSGTLSIKDVEAVKLNDIHPNRTRVVPANGCVEDFNNYDYYTDLYYWWDQSFANVDEGMDLDYINKIGDLSNPACGEFDYKADMEHATYEMDLDTTAVLDKTAFQVWFKDCSKKSSDPYVSYLKDEDVAADMTIQLNLDSGEIYRYNVPLLKKVWTNYTITFKDFTLANKVIGTPTPITSNHITHIGYGFQYFYKDSMGNPHPTYAIANPVLLDEMYFVEADETSITEIKTNIEPDPLDTNTTYIDTFESYPNTGALGSYWSYTEKAKNSLELSDEVSTTGDTKSLKLNYNSTDKVKFTRLTPFADSVSAKQLQIDIKADGKATIYIVLNYRVGTTVYPLLKTIAPSKYGSSSDWYHYEIGFAKFVDSAHSSVSVSSATCTQVESITIYASNGDSSESSIYVDNIKFYLSAKYTADTATLIPNE